MKNFNLLSKMCSPLVGSQSNDVGFDCRLTVGSPSFDCRLVLLKLVSVLVLILTIGSGNAWGATLTCTFESVAGKSFPYDAAWTLGNGSENTSYHHGGSRCLQFSETTSVIIRTTNKINGTVTNVTFYAGRTTKNNTSTNVYIQTSTDGSTWTTQKTFDIAKAGRVDQDNTNNWTTVSQDLKNVSNCYVRITRGGSSTAVRVIDDITITYTPAVSYTITATRNNDSYGTVSVDGTTITATPADCYQVISGIDGYTVTSGTASVSHTGTSNTLTVTPSTDCTVRVNFEKKTVNTYIDEIQDNGTTEECDTHDAPSLDDKTPANSGTCAQQHWHFMGWVTAANKANPTDLNIITAGTSMTANGTTYYAVWAKGEGSVFDGSTEGTYLIYANDNGTNYYATNTVSSNSLQTTSTIGSAQEFTLAKSGDYWTISYKSGNSTYYLTASSTATINAFSTTSSTWRISSGTYGTWRIWSSSTNSGSDAYAYRALMLNSSHAFKNYCPSNDYLDCEIGTPIEYSDYICACCTELGSINGSVKVISGTSATLQWDVLSGVDGTTPYSVSVSPSEGTSVGGISTVDGRKNCTISGLTAGTEYTFTINAFGDGSHCDKSQDVVATTPKITLGSASGTSTYIEGSGPGSKQTFTVTAVGLTGNLTVTAPTNFEVCDTENGSYASSKTLTATSGAVSTTVYFRLVTGKTAASSPYAGNITVSGGSATEQTVAVNGTVSVSCEDPTITVQPAVSASYNMNVIATPLSVTATRNGTGPALTYQWYSNTSNSKTTPEPTLIDDATSDSYTPLTTATGTKYYFCEVSSGACAVTSNISAITVNTPTITVSETSRAFGDRAKDGSYEMTFTVSGSNLAKDAGISLALGGTNAGMFSIDKTSVAQTSVGVVSETTITVTYHPTANGSHSATITISSTGVANKTVTLSGTSKNAATVTLHVAGSTSSISPELPKETWLEGDSYTLPSGAAECPEMGLYGWYTSDYEHATTAPSGANFSSPGANKSLAAGDNHFYAVYATVTPDAADTYTKITTTGELVTGDYLIVGDYASSMRYAMKNSIYNTSYFGETSVTISDNKINSNPGTDYIWRITRSNTNVTIKNGSDYAAVSSGSAVLSATVENYTFSVTDGVWALTSGSYLLGYGYNFGARSSADKNIYLFKRDPSIAGPYTTTPSCTTHSLSTAVTPISTGTAEAAKTVVGEGKTTTVTATPSDHFVFSYWTISGTGSTMSNTTDGKSTDNPVTVTMGTDDATITAHFTEKEKCTVVFMNNGATESSTTYWLGEHPIAPTLTDGVSNDACDATSDKHYGWTRNLITGNVADQATLDARTGSDVVYTKAATLPAITAGDDGTTITYHAVWAQATGSGSGNYELVEEDLGTEWAGDYLIAYTSEIFADGRVGGTGTGGIGAQSTHVTPGDNLSANGKVVAASWGDTYYVTLEEISENSNTYVLKTQDDVYNYQSSNANGLASTVNKATAANYPITVNFEAANDIELALGEGADGAIFHYNNNVLGSGGDVFRYYKNGGMQPIYLYKKMGGTTYSTFLTTCCDKNVTLATNSPANGSITFSPSGTIATCGADAATRQTTMTVTPDAGYYLSAWSTTGVTPASLSTDIAYGSTSNSGAQATTVTFTQNTTTGTYTANATFTAIPVSSLTLHAIKKDNTSATIFDETGNNVALSLYPTEGKTASPADPLGHTVKIEFGAVLPANALNKGYTWSATVNGAAVGWSTNNLENNAVLEFNKSTGKVVAKAAGTAEIIITADDGSGVTAKVTITVTNVALSSLNVAKSSTTLYVGESEEIAVTYDPLNTTTKGYTTGSYTYVTIGRANDKITLTGKTTASEVTETVTLTSSDAGAKTATIDVTVKPLPKVTFVDNLQGKTDFSNWGSDGVVSSTVTDGVVTHTKPTPSHTDISDPGSSYNTCERQHLHLVGWILSTWADAHPGATHEQIVGANVSNGAGTFLEAGADFNVETYNGNTYYAVWAKVE